MNPTEAISNTNPTSNSNSTNEIVKCGNCDQIGPAIKNRSLWAQIIVWLVFIFMWPVTLLYYVMNPKYSCSNCKSSFVGVKQAGRWVAVKNSSLKFFIFIFALICGIAVIGIIASIIIASLSTVREKIENGGGINIQAGQSSTSTDVKVNIPGININVSR